MLGRADRRYAAILFALVLLVAVALSSVALGAEQNEACTACHSSSGQWAVGDVDRSTACSKCHTPGLLGAHPYHNPGSNCGAVCHPGWGASLQFATPAWRGPQGSFASAESPDVPASILHVIHASPRWLADVGTSSSNCASCHSVAACTACHEDPLSDGHAVHSSTGNASYPKQDPWTGVMGSGIVGEDQSIDTAAEQTNQCATPGCHDLAGTQSRSAITREDHVTGVVKDPVANWAVKYGSNYTGGRIAYASRANSKITLTFTGQQVEVLTDKDPYRGVIAISVDGGPETLIDCYSSTTAFQKVVFRSDTLDAGTHSVSVRVTGQKNPAARAAYGFIDAFKFYGDMPENISPECVSCHAVGSSHGFSHEASMTAGSYETFACSSCHVLTLTTEHKRPSSVTEPAGCAACHTTYADYELDLYNYTCSQAGGAGAPTCHQGASVPHTAKDASHTVTPVTETADCIACHSGDLGLIHDDTNAARPQHASLVGGGSNGLAYDTDCLTCHSASAVPAETSCVSAACHAESGVVSMATHPAPDHDANPALGEVPHSADKSCSTCHAINAGSGKVELVGEHSKASSVTEPGGAAIGCGSCHNASYFPSDWMGENDTCVACHIAEEAGLGHEDAEYAAKHNFTADAGNGLSCGAGAGAFCHATDAVDLIHDASNPGAADCESCHTAAVRQTGVPTVRVCSTCHSASHDMTKHVTTASAECVTCHASADVRDLHADCATCHANPSYPGLTGSVATADCVNCHAATGALASDDYSPVDPNHATGTETTHTATPFTAAYQGAGGDGTVAAGGKECLTCHSATLKPAHASTSTNGGAVVCAECHLDTTLGSSATVAADWPEKKCTDCHDSGAATTHAEYGSTHVVPAGTCADTGTSCHNYMDLAKLHDKNQAGAGPKYSSCANADAGDPTPCHSMMDDRPERWASDAGSCGEGTSGCHQEKSASNHGKKHTLTVSSSGYTDGSGEGVPAGCLATGGGGCHDSLGASNTSTDVADYHQTTECAASVCHTSADKPTHHVPFICGDCHDGTYQGAADTTALADADTAGHYPDLKHTATGGLGNVNTGGTAEEACSVCHDLSLRPAHTGISSPTKGANVTCVECHAYNLSVTAQVKVSSWTTDSCSDCHTAAVIAGSIQHANSVAVAVPATASAGCASSGRNCHSAGDLHSLHKDAADGCDLAGCHDATNKNVRPTKTSCGASGDCHKTGFNTNTSFPTHTPSEEGAHAPTTNTQETASWSVASQSIACGACHLVSAADGGLLSEHAAANSTMTVSPGNACLNCHDSSASDASIAGTWATNRDTANACATCHSASTGIAAHANENAAAHTDVTSASCGNTGAGCHPTNNLASVGTPSTTANIHLNCLRCHDHTGSASVPAPGGGNMKWDPAKDTCGNGRECHNIAGQYPVTGDPLHRSGLADVANGDDTTHHTGVTANKTNYPETAAGVYSDNLACASCHSNTLKTAHSVTSTNGGAVTCLECHNGSGAITGATAAGQVKGDWSTDKCTDCHTPATTHASFKTGASTYSANHTASMNAGCAGSGTGCHGTRPDSLTSVAPAGEMVQLHTTPGCSASSGTAGTSCHALNKPMAATGKTCGSGSNCHNTYTTTAGHAGNTVTGNDTLHTVTVASMDTVTDATYTYGVQCKNCHSSGLTTAHTGVTVSMESGASWAAGATPFCTNCHNTTTPDNAASVIKTTTWNMTCDACHVTSGNGKHTEYAASPAKHNANTSGCTLASGCHGFTGSQTMNTRAVHDRSGAGCSVSGTDSKGWAGSCHQLDKQMTAGTMTCGDTGACHTGHTGTNHGYTADKHLANGAAINAVAGYAFADSNACFGCHYENIYRTAGGVAQEHELYGITCEQCHNSGTAGAGVYAIAQGATVWDKTCQQCHTGAAGFASAIHGAQDGNLKAASVATSGDSNSFPSSTTWNGTTNAAAWGGHRVRSTYRNYVTSFTTPNVKANWNRGTLINANTMLTNPRTGSAWTGLDNVYCSDCHDYVAGGGPHGAAVTVNLKAGAVWNNTVTMGTAGVLCGNCHDMTKNVNGAHTKHGGGTGGVTCWDCHISIPHGWKRPAMLLRRDVDAAPYNRAPAGTGALMAVKPTIILSTAGTAANATNSDCYANCSSQHRTKPTSWIDYGAAPALP